MILKQHTPSVRELERPGDGTLTELFVSHGISRQELERAISLFSSPSSIDIPPGFGSQVCYNKEGTVARSGDKAARRLASGNTRRMNRHGSFFTSALFTAVGEK